MEARESHPCRTTCPGSATQLDIGHEAEDAQSDDDDPDWSDIMNGAVTVFSTQTRQTTHLLATALIPQLNNLDVGGRAQPLWIPDSPTLILTTISRPPHYSHLQNPWRPHWQADHPPFVNFQNFELAINQTRMATILANNESFCLSAGSVSAVARGLVNALKGVKQKRHARLAPYKAINNTEANPDFYLTEPADLSLSTLFSLGDWVLGVQSMS